MKKQWRALWLLQAFGVALPIALMIAPPGPVKHKPVFYGGLSLVALFELVTAIFINRRRRAHERELADLRRHLQKKTGEL
jgi:hypothetical protein